MSITGFGEGYDQTRVLYLQVFLPEAFNSPILEISLNCMYKHLRYKTYGSTHKSRNVTHTTKQIIDVLVLEIYQCQIAQRQCTTE